MASQNELRQNLSRRDFLRVGSATVSAVSVISLAGVAAPLAHAFSTREVTTLPGAATSFIAQDDYVTLQELNFSNFSSLTGQTFSLAGAAQGLTLLHANSLAKPATKDARPEGFREPFSLIFVSENQLDLSSGIHELSHHSTGQMAVMMSPVGNQNDAHGQRYEVVFG